VLLVQWRKAAASGRKSSEPQKAPPASLLEGFASGAEAAAGKRCPLDSSEN